MEQCLSFFVFAEDSVGRIGLLGVLVILSSADKCPVKMPSKGAACLLVVSGTIQRSLWKIPLAEWTQRNWSANAPSVITLTESEVVAPHDDAFGGEGSTPSKRSSQEDGDWRQILHSSTTVTTSPVTVPTASDEKSTKLATEKLDPFQTKRASERTEDWRQILHSLAAVTTAALDEKPTERGERERGDRETVREGRKHIIGHAGRTLLEAASKAESTKVPSGTRTYYQSRQLMLRPCPVEPGSTVSFDVALSALLAKLIVTKKKLAQADRVNTPHFAASFAIALLLLYGVLECGKKEDRGSTFGCLF